jgi:hypothetical protein
MKLALLVGIFMLNAFGQIVITDTGSTNRPGMTVTLGAKGHAVIANRRGGKTEMQLEPELQSRLLKDLEAAAPLDQINARHCMKSASFGSSLFVTYKGVRSPDLSCGGQSDPNAMAVQKDMQEVMAQARAKIPASDLRR